MLHTTYTKICQTEKFRPEAVQFADGNGEGLQDIIVVHGDPNLPFHFSFGGGEESAGRRRIKSLRARGGKSGISL
jgi:hypothetical protein